MSELDLAAVIERIDRLARQRMAEDGTPGLVLALTNRDGLLHAAAYGYANVETREPMTTGHLLETGSIGFDTIVDGVALRMPHSGDVFYRFFTP